MKRTAVTLALHLAATEENGRQVIPGLSSLAPDGLSGFSDLNHLVLHKLEFAQLKKPEFRALLYPFYVGNVWICIKCSGSGTLDRGFVSAQNLKPPHQLKKMLFVWLIPPLWPEVMKEATSVWYPSGHNLLPLMQRMQADIVACTTIYTLTEGSKEEEKFKCGRTDWRPRERSPVRSSIRPLLGRTRSELKTCSRVSGSRAEEGKYQIFVKTISGKTISLWVSGRDTGETINTLIEQREGYPRPSFYIMYEGKILQVDDRLRDC